METPYSIALNEYLTAGWASPLPLPPRSKFAPPKGFTGRSGGIPTEEDFITWVSRGGNIALRMPDTIVGFDIDAYGSKVGKKTFDELVDKLGELPATWASSRHEDIQNGRTLLFTVPAGLAFISGFKDIDIIQSGHRYLTAPPSIHPSGAVYRWITPGGFESQRFPEVDEIPSLPEAWLNEIIDKPKEDTVVLGEVEAWDANLGWLPGGLACNILKDKLSYYIKGFKSCNGRHDFLVKSALSLIYTAQKGHHGITPILDELQTHWVQMMVDDRGLEVAVHEFDSVVSWAVTQVHSKTFGLSGKTEPCNEIKRFTGGKSYSKNYRKKW